MIAEDQTGGGGSGTGPRPERMCRNCGAGLRPFMSFGPMPLANGFLTADRLATLEHAPEYFYELAVAFCGSCSLFQIMDQPDPRLMFHDDYAFFSHSSRVMAEHFRELAQEIMTRWLTGADPLVVEIGSNDGILLKHVAAAGLRHQGIEPSANVARAGIDNGVNTLCAFFDPGTAQTVHDRHGPADVIVAANVMCHIPDLRSVVRGVDLLLKPDGVLIFEDPYLGDVIRKTAYDQIYDEHVFLFSLTSVTNIFAPHGFELIDAVPQETHGGSMRYVLARRGRHVPSERVAAWRAREAEEGLGRPETYERFRRNCEASRNRLRDLLTSLKERGCSVAGYGATSKSTTVLKYCGISRDLIPFISDTTPLKQGRFTPGMHIPVLPPDAFSSSYPDYAVLFAWNHEREIFEKEQEFRRRGGRWIRFVPDVGVV